VLLRFFKMKKILHSSLVIGVTIVLLHVFGSAAKQPNWGFFGHQRINRMAVFTLPADMMPLYKKNIEYITEHAVDPDKRRYATRLEAFRHFIDADHWGKAPFPNLPRKWTDALARYTDVYIVTDKNDTLQLAGDKVTRIDKKNIVLRGKDIRKIFKTDSVSIDYRTYRNFFFHNIESQYYEENWTVNTDSLTALFAKKDATKHDFGKCKTAFAKDRFTEYGIVPYHLEYMQRRLTQAFKDRDTRKILRLSAEIGHYIGDAHVPLHTTENYNGQFTNQVGIHGFWESRLPELFADTEYDFFVGKAEYIPKYSDFAWKTILDSHALLDTVLNTERELVKKFPEDKQMCYEQRADANVLLQCKEFSRAWHTRMNGMVETRMCAAIKAVGNAWYTAWVDAGQPNLADLDKKPLTKEEQKEQEKLEEAAKDGTMIGRQE
jgi:hypothetical protein